jgi:acyl-CoA synthetase (AMP-forming)/AMP-acid ligase II/acyl carrier protein
MKSNLEGHRSVTLPQSPRFAGSLVEILSWRAEHQPDDTAYIFLNDGEGDETWVSYLQLDRASRSIAGALQGIAAPGERVLLLYPSGPHFIAAFFGCLRAGLIAVPLYPPRPNRTLSRLLNVVADSGARLALTQTDRLADLAQYWPGSPELKRISYHPADYRPDAAGGNAGVPCSGSDVAYLQYTSGSTSDPKGVMVTHDNLVYNCVGFQETLRFPEGSASVNWVPHFHDHGLILGMLSPIFSGYTSVVLSPTLFARRPLLWLEAVSRFKAWAAGGPNFSYELCMQKIKPEDLERLDLSSWHVALNGAEPIRQDTLDRFSAYFGPCGFRPQSICPAYGLAEATLIVSIRIAGSGNVVFEAVGQDLEQGLARRAPAGTDGKVRSLVGCGGTWLSTGVEIVDPTTLQVSPPGAVGEIWVNGPTVASGYWGRPEDTEATFNAHTADGAGPFLRTGDLGFMETGELYPTGRLKDLIIVRGGNYYPQDIEWISEAAHPALRRGFAAAFGVEVEGEERLVVVAEVDRRYRKASVQQLESVASSIRQAVAGEFELETYCVQLLTPGSVHRTSSGKVQRRKCRADFLAGQLETVWESWLSPPRESGHLVRERKLRRDDLARLRPRERQRALINYLRRSVAEVMGIMVHYVEPDKPLGSLGLDSLKGTELTSLLQEELGIELSTTMVWNYPTIADIASHVAQRMGVPLDDITGLDGLAASNGYPPGANKTNGVGSGSGKLTVRHTG